VAKPSALSTLRTIFGSRRMAAVFLIAFGSGLPLLLIGQTARYLATDAMCARDQVTALVAVGLPFTFKWAWAPLLDRARLPFLGRRRGWLLAFQLLLVPSLVVLGKTDPATAPGTFFGVLFVTTMLTASHDIVVDAYNTDLLEPHERAAGVAVYVLGYRVGMLTAGSLALVLSDHIGWPTVYLVMAALMNLGMLGTFLAQEPPERGLPLRTLTEAVVRPFSELFRRLGWRTALVTLGFAATYKFGDQLAQLMQPDFYKNQIGFTNTDIGVAGKITGFAAAAVGGVFGGVMVARHGVRKMLVAFGLLQASVHVGYLAIAIAGKSLPVYVVATFVENVAYAMGAGVFLAALMGLCNPAVSATQFALLTSLSSVGERVFGRFASDIVDAVGYKGFFLSTMAMALPGLLLAWLATGQDGERRSAPIVAVIPTAKVARSGADP
jgi:PAT family beta-lactamase induction signal transducer AmpG